MKCLLLKTPDDRCFFTDEKNYPLLVEFGRTFDAEISVVKIQDQVKILEMDDLAKSICDQEKKEIPQYTTLEVKLPSKLALAAEANKQRLKKTHELQEVIRKKFLNRETVSINDVSTLFPASTKTVISNHLTRVRRELESQGHSISKEKPGQYRLV